MVSYLIRRILLMIPTLIGITIMVFLIARMAPGRPGQMQLGAAGVTAEEMKALQEWYDKKYGLDDPLYMQYLNWWQSMFTRDVLAAAWYDPGDDSPLRPVQTWRTQGPEYYAHIDGTWVQLSDISRIEQVLSSADPALRDQLSEADRATLLPVEDGYAAPQHRIISATTQSIESLDQGLEDGVVEPARELIAGNAMALAWTESGYPLYENPDDPERPIFQRAGDWILLTPRLPAERWTKLAIDDAQLKPILRHQLDEQPPALDGYAIPRHAIASGAMEPLDTIYDPAALTRLQVPVRVSVPTRLWIVLNDDDADADGHNGTSGRLYPVFEAAEAQPTLFVELAPGQWSRIVGTSRVDEPEIDIVEQDAALAGRLDDADRAALPSPDDRNRVPRHAIIHGKTVPIDFVPTSRQVRRYQHETRIFEVTLGESNVTRQPVIDELWPRLKITLGINLIAFPLVYLIAIPTGMGMAVKRGKYFDTVANTMLLAAWSIPSVLAATLLIGYTARGGEGIELFPNGGLSSGGAETWPFIGYFDADGKWVPGWLTDRAWHLILPIICIVYGGIAYLAKQMRAAMLDNFTMDYVRTAKAKGVQSRDILFRHVLRNSLLPLITIFATILPALIAGSIIIETVFTIEGMGRWVFRAVQNRDYDVVQALALIAGALNLTGLLIADICYALADPRITYS
ncbi:MAG: ABC transporter permease subunit [Phycisphaerales bacterium]